MGLVSVRDLQFHSAVDDIRGQTVQLDDLGVAGAVAEKLLRDCPERIAMHDGMYTIGFGGGRSTVNQ